MKWKVTFNSPLILGFVTVCFIALVLNFITNGSSNQLFFMTYRSSIKSPLTYIRLMTHVFGHAGWQHFIGNMSYILLLGPMLEEKYGSAQVLLVMAVTAVITALFNSIFFANIGLCGASGICFAFILLASFTSVKMGEIPLTFILVALIYLGQQIYEGIAVQNNISNMSHIIGGIVGSVTGFLLNTKEIQ